MNNISTETAGGLRKCIALIRELQGYLKYTSGFSYNFRKVTYLLLILTCLFLRRDSVAECKGI